MRRISSLPTAEYCPMVDKTGQDVESTQAARSTVFHAYCETGKWPDGLRSLPEADREEISKWCVPMPFVMKSGNVTHALPYKDAMREERVAVDERFNYVDVPREVPQSEIAAQYPQAIITGHLDMAWDIPSLDLVVVCDIKSSIFAVKDGTASLQLHGYGLAVAAKLGRSRYLTAIWDASEGRYYVASEAVEVDSFEACDLKDRIRFAASEREGGFRTGIHCGGCWKRTRCPAHLVDVPEGEFKAVLSGTAMEKDIREALIKVKQSEDLAKEVRKSIKAWIEGHGYVRSEDGKKVYKCEMRSGRKSLDEDAVSAALGVPDLKDYMKVGAPFPAFEWRKAD